MSDSKGKITTAIVIGAGQRGFGYAHYQEIKPEEFRVIAVADPKKYQRERLQTLCNISDDMVFQDWREVAEREKFADCVMICTQDQQHKEPAVAFAKKGYHILLEKPMATTEEDCREIVRVCKENNVFLTVCHVLRYTPWVKKIKELIDSGAIGDVVNIQHLEPVGYWHFAHSFVRGSWHKESESSFSLLAKCCHDVDLLCHWMGPQKCQSVSSFGHLSHFSQSNKVGYWHFAHSYVRGNWHKESESSSSLMAKCCHDIDLVCHWMGEKKCQRVSSFGHLSRFNKENKPKKAANRCLDCPKEVESKCPYSAVNIYINNGIKSFNKGWPVSVLTSGPPDLENVTEALRTGPYGRCVYDMDNDVMSQQVVNMQFTGGATATLSMIGFTESVCTREVNVFGTKGEIRYKDGYESVLQVDFTTEQRYHHKLDSRKHGPLSGHGGADYCMMENFESALYHKDFSQTRTGADETLASHLVVFAAEKARKENRVVTINEDMSFA